MSSSFGTAFAGLIFASLLATGCMGDLKPGGGGGGSVDASVSDGNDDGNDSADGSDTSDSADNADSADDSTDQSDDSADSSDDSSDQADDSSDSSDDSSDQADDSSDDSSDSDDSDDSSDSTDDSADDSSDDGDDSSDGDGNGELVWRQARLTHFTSYPEPGSEECEDFNGCMWAGCFAFVEGKQSENWVMMHNIVAVHEKDGDWLGLKTLRLRKDGDEIDVTVYDVCSDSDCNGCCSNNAAETGYLVDIEKYTQQKFGHGDGTVDWACLDCD